MIKSQGKLEFPEIKIYIFNLNMMDKWMSKQELKNWNGELMIPGIQHKIENIFMFLCRKIKMALYLSQPVEILE